MYQKAKFLLDRLIDQNHEAYFVGGFPRDFIRNNFTMNGDFLDVDITTSATPDEIANALKPVCQDINYVGKNYGVIIADGVEIAMFRTEEYEKQGKPNVEAAHSLLEDLKRRDFTINTICIDSKGRIVDLCNGMSDLQEGVIRAVGNPVRRFEEDPSRILRALYFAARFNFTIESLTANAIRESSSMVSSVPFELIGKIIMKVASFKVLHKFVKLLNEFGLLNYVFPELSHTVGMPQNPKYHHLNVFDHIVEVIRHSETKYPHDILMLFTALYHDNRKAWPTIRSVNKDGQPNDLGHEEAGAQPAYDAIIRLGFGKTLASEVYFQVMFHGIPIPEKMKKKTVVKLLKKMVPYCKNKEELEIKVYNLFRFMDLDASGFAPDFSNQVKKEKSEASKLFIQVLEETIFYTHELPVAGKDLISFGFKGKEIGDLLQLFVQHNWRTKEEIYQYLSRHYKLDLLSS